MLAVIITTIVISLVGTLAHFFYDLSHHNKFIGLFAAVNESTWEHVKIALTPILFCGLYDGYMYGQNPNYFLAKFVSLIIPIVLIPCLFYGYKLILKKDVMALSIIIFYVAVFLSQLSFYGIINCDPISHSAQYFSTIGVFIVFGGYAVLTLMPLELSLFKDPITSKYGFRAHSEKFNPFKKKKRK